MIRIHPTALVDKEAQLGENVEIGPFCVISGDVIIGDNTVVESGVVLENGTRLGKNCRIGHHSVISGPPQDLKFGGEKTSAEVGDNTVIREYVTINRGTTYHYKSVIGQNCFLMAYAHVAHDCIVGDRVILANAVNMGGHVEVHSDATIGGMTAIHQFCKVGKYAFVGGGLRVTQDIPPFIRTAGEPPRYAGTNYIGLSRKGFSQETILEIKRAYRIIYKDTATRDEAIQAIQTQLQQLEEINAIVKFLQESKRGIIRG